MVATKLNGRVRAGVVLAAVLVIGVLLGAAVRGASSSSPDTAARQPAPAPEAEDRGGDPGDPDTGGEESGSVGGPGPSSSLAGVGVGFDQSEQGAVAAAMSYATASQSWLYLSDEDLTAVAEAVVAPRSRDRLVGTLVDDVRLLRDELSGASGTVWFVVSPLATKLESYSEDRAVVRVWTVRVLSADEVAVPQSGWLTVTLDLEWDGDWLVADVTEAEGPTPQLEAGLQPWSAAYLDETLAGFLRVGVL